MQASKAYNIFIDDITLISKNSKFKIYRSFAMS